MAATAELEGADSAPLPTALVACTVKVYAFFGNREGELTLIGLAAPVAVIPPGLDVTVYDVIGLPPSPAGGVKATVNSKLPVAVAVTPVGAPGSVGSVTELEGAERKPAPSAL